MCEWRGWGDRNPNNAPTATIFTTPFSALAALLHSGAKFLQ